MKNLLKLVGIVLLQLFFNSCASKCYKSNELASDSFVLHIKEFSLENNSYCYICDEGNFKIKVGNTGGYVVGGKRYNESKSSKGNNASWKGYFSVYNDDILKLSEAEPILKSQMEYKFKYIKEDDAFIKEWYISRKSNSIYNKSSVAILNNENTELKYLYFSRTNYSYKVEFLSDRIIVRYFWYKKICPETITGTYKDFCKDY